ncbi:WapI family immunity protein [Hymenobacter terrestris]|uniref:Uncharacterized protein n=1 Tax=Hymenobacter terrestris TaxID=2748310 RepID=A0ABX2Q6H4_9BACT|nr:hypothetical protein [Hymenobacter terrestris]NVO86572.1 hypothetical protein [Hymenobacter terrestris]
MEDFTIQGIDAFLTISLTEVYGFPDETCHWGGYDARAAIKIQTGGFSVNAEFWTSTGELSELYRQLSDSNEQVAGAISFRSYEEHLNFTAHYNSLGHVIVAGTFSEQDLSDNKLQFEIQTDQSYIQATLIEMKRLVAKYGGMKGVKS